MTAAAAPPAFTCPKCGFLNQDEDDVAEGYCEKCKEHTGPPEYLTVVPRTWTKLPRSDGIVIRIESDRPVRIATRYFWPPDLRQH